MIDAAEADMIVSIFESALADTVDAAALLVEWTAKYPELAADFAAIAVEREAGFDDAAFEPQAERQAILMQSLLPHHADSTAAQDENPRIASPPRYANVEEASAARGIAYPAGLAARLRLPAPLLEKIAARRIDVQSIPVVLIQQIAGVLEVGRDQVASWFVPPPTIGAAAYVREAAAPYGAPSTFAKSIENAVDLDESDRAYWRAVIEASRTVGDMD